jgi:hypothetical protein
MKDKALRKLLKEKGLIGLYNGYELEDHNELIYPSFIDTCNGVRKLNTELGENVRSIKTLGNWINEVSDENIRLSARIIDLEYKFDAINKHYGIEVERQDARYVVKESE